MGPPAVALHAEREKEQVRPVLVTMERTFVLAK